MTPPRCRRLARSTAPRFDTLFLAAGAVSWRGTLVQYTVQLHRLHPGKCDIRIFDYVDRDAPMLLHIFKKQLRGYRVISYARRAQGAIFSIGWTIVGGTRNGQG
jgi:superfamily II DNA or RNA helicase